MTTNKKIQLSLAALTLALGLSGPIVVSAAGPATVNLGSSGNFVILAKSGISTTGVTKITGDIGVSPIFASAITGFGLTVDSSNKYSTSAQVTGKVYAADYAFPTPANMTTAISDMQTAYTDAAGRTLPTATELGAGNIGGMTLAPGLYKWGTGVTIPTDVTLSGSANDVWIFQVAQTLTMSSAAKIILSGGAQANNIFWVVAGQTTIGTTAVFNGNILDQTAIVLNTGATLNGRALAQTAVTLDSNAVTLPSSGSATPAVPATPAIPATPPSGTNGSATPATPAVPATPATPLANNGGGNLEQKPFDAPTTMPNTSAFVEPIQMIMVNLGKGNRGEQVKILQEFLIVQNKGSAARTLARVGATSYFGTLTRAALAEFQKNVGIGPAWGNFGPITRGYINAH